MTSEAEFTSAVIDLARLLGWRVTHFRPAQVRPGKWVTPLQGDPGFPDLVLARDGVVILAELKSDKGRLGPGQPEWAEQIGAQYRLWRPRDLGQIRQELQRVRPRER
jgi:hypothetical protein